MIEDPRHLRESVDDAIRSSVNYAVNVRIVRHYNFSRLED